MHTVYTITHPDSGIYYIGRTQDFDKRYKNHLNQLKHGKHPNVNLQKIYSDDTDLIFDSFDIVSKDDAMFLEREMIAYHKDDPLLANFHMAKTSDKVIATYTDERRDEIRQRMTGTKHSDITLAKMREAQKNSKPSKEAQAKAAEVNKVSVCIDGVYYRTASEAANILGWHVATILNRVRNPRPQWDTWQLVEGN